MASKKSTTNVSAIRKIVDHSALTVLLSRKKRLSGWRWSAPSCNPPVGADNEDTVSGVALGVAGLVGFAGVVVGAPVAGLGDAVGAVAGFAGVCANTKVVESAKTPTNSVLIKNLLFHTFDF